MKSNDAILQRLTAHLGQQQSEQGIPGRTNKAYFRILQTFSRTILV